MNAKEGAVSADFTSDVSNRLGENQEVELRLVNSGGAFKQATQMPKTFTRRQFFLASTAGLCVTTSGCGTLLYPERVGQRRGDFDNIDWTVVGMNTIGLVLFVVPGLIAFAIDFHNGSLFYPSGHYGQLQPSELKSKSFPTQNVSVTMVEQAISEEVGKPIRLQKGNFFSRKLTSLDQFWDTFADMEILS